MRLSLRLVLSLLLVAAIAAFAFTFAQVEREKSVLVGDLQGRALTLAESLQLSVRIDLRENKPKELSKLVSAFGNRDNLLGTAVFNQGGGLVAGTPGISPLDESSFLEARQASETAQKVSGFTNLNGRKVLVYAVPLKVNNQQAGALLLLFNASYIQSELKDVWQDSFFYFLFQAIFIITATILILRWGVMDPIARFADWLKESRTGKKDGAIPSSPPQGDILAPVVEEASRLVKSLSAARAAASREAKLRVKNESLWTAEKLKEQARLDLGSKTLIVVSNREPYVHVRSGQSADWIVPSGGLVTALDPVLRACGGLWIAHGSGEMDRETSDERGKLKVPPDEPAYTLRRVWLTKEEEEGYYYGFSNEGLWPLCHITHTRPIFRLEDWVEYQKVNQKFADAILEEIKDEKEPAILVQDYHMALVPLLVKSARPDARTALFWHIPWPNPEAFGICPWKKEILLGMLGADLIGFHVQFHCNNFLETVDRFLESRTDREHFTVERQGSLTRVKPFPISVAFPALDDGTMNLTREDLRKELFKPMGGSPEIMALGVDRVDYTKGIVERFKAVKRFLEKHPEYVGRFSFVELGSPSRTHIQRYHDLLVEIDKTVDEINWQFQTRNWKPILYLKANHSHQTVHRFYRACDLCMVTSLHDGMNLVSKEFASCRDDEGGVLILSEFTGAARDLRDSIIINPYDTEGMADALYQAITMPAEEQRERMRHLREAIKERNVYGWAASLISELAKLRLTETAEIGK